MCSIWVGLLLVSGSPSAMEKFQEGLAAYRAGDCQAALTAWDQAQRLKRTTGLFRRIAECRARLGDLVGARDALTSYLADPSSPEAAEARAELAQLERRLSEREAKARADAEARSAAAAASAQNRLEAELRAKSEAESRALAESEGRAKAERAVAEAEARVRAEAEARAKAERAVAESEGRLRREAEARAKAERLGADAESRARTQAEARAAADKARQEAETRASQLALALAETRQTSNLPLPALSTPSGPLDQVPPRSEPGRGPSRLSRAGAVALAVAAGVALTVGIAFLVDSRNVVARNRRSTEPGTEQEIDFEEAQRAVEGSRIGWAISSGGAGFLILSTWLAW